MRGARCARCAVRGARCAVRGARCAVYGPRPVVRGARCAGPAVRGQRSVVPVFVSVSSLLLLHDGEYCAPTVEVELFWQVVAHLCVGTFYQAQQ